MAKNIHALCSQRNVISSRRQRETNLLDFVRTIVIVFSICTSSFVECSENKKDTNVKHDNNNNKLNLVKSESRGFSDIYVNGTFRTGNMLWDNILNECTLKPSVTCLQKNVYSYLDQSLEFDDVKLANGVCFKKNNVDINKYTKEANIIYVTGSNSKDIKKEERSMDEENEISDDEESETPLEEVTDALYDKGIKFLVTHDMKLTLPEFFFHGATLKISPRALTKTGALIHVDLEPKEEPNGEGRIFFKKIKKYLRKKLIMAALAILLVVKLIALKVVFVLPLIFGVTTAKKLFLKLLLFVFPALSHIFKLCSWYHNNYHTTKYHHHHHLITHHHKPSYNKPYPSPVVVRPHGAGPPPGGSFEPYNQDWELSGPGLGSEYLAADIHRNAIGTFKPQLSDANDINAWGLSLPPGPSMNVGEYASSNIVSNVVQSPNNGQPSYNNNGRPMGPPNPYTRTKKTTPIDPEKESLIRAASLAARAPPSPVRNEVLRVSAAKLSESNRVKAETDLIRQQQQIIAAHDPETIAAEKFYGALLDNMDKILSPMGATDVGCRERAICALYKQPFEHTPFSNLVSNELSKDSSELLPPGDSKMAIHYYRYVQAARDGQEQKNCLIEYPNCNIDYGMKK